PSSVPHSSSSTTRTASGVPPDGRFFTSAGFGNFWFPRYSGPSSNMPCEMPPKPKGDAGHDIADLYRRHAPALHRRCASIVGNAEEARDLVQETFARYISARANWTDRASPFTVLYRIATNASIDRLRRRKTAAAEELDPDTKAGDLGGEPRRIENLHD